MLSSIHWQVEYTVPITLKDLNSDSTINQRLIRLGSAKIASAYSLCEAVLDYVLRVRFEDTYASVGAWGNILVVTLVRQLLIPPSYTPSIPRF